MEFSKPLSFITEKSNHWQCEVCKEKCAASYVRAFEDCQLRREGRDLAFCEVDLDNVNLSTLVLILSLHCCLILSSTVLRCFKGKVLTGGGGEGREGEGVATERRRRFCL